MRRHTVRKRVVTQNITVDGAIEMLGDWFSPQAQAEVDNSDLLGELHRHNNQADALLLGRQTFENFRGYWPHQSGDATGITDYLNKVQKYVASSTMTDPQWKNSQILTDDPVGQVRALKADPGRDIVLTGSITLCHALIVAGLVDEYRLFVYPVVLGQRRRLFPDGYEVPRLGCSTRRVSVAASPSCATPPPGTSGDPAQPRRRVTRGPGVLHDTGTLAAGT
jgi:dihydrofolate reductase